VIGAFDIRHLEGSNYNDFAGLEVKDLVSPALCLPGSKTPTSFSGRCARTGYTWLSSSTSSAPPRASTAEDLTEEIVGGILVGGER